VWWQGGRCGCGHTRVVVHRVVVTHSGASGGGEVVVVMHGG
jgi:hypothetical protein